MLISSFLAIRRLLYKLLNFTMLSKCNNNIAMNHGTLEVVDGRYPFGKGFAKAQVKEVQAFSSVEQMRQKKTEMIKKSEMVTNPSIIRIEFLAEQDANLVYFYEFVPDSLQSYLRGKRQGQSGQIWQMTKTLLVKKLNFQLTMLISYLAKMKIQTELALHHLGMSEDEKLRIYISPRSKMGIKSEVQLIVVYNHSKDKIMKELQAIYEKLEMKQPLAEPLQTNGHKVQQVGQPAGMKAESKKCRFGSIPKIDVEGSRLRQTRTFKESNDYRKRKMSTGQFDLGSSTELPRMNQKPSLSRQKDHKYSFQQFGNDSHPFQSFQQPNAPDPSRASRERNSFGDYNQASEEGTGIPHSKSIKIQLQQTQNFDQKKKRKDSYKVKITTFREYELEGNPANLFGGDMNNEADIFQYFAKKAKQDEEQQQERREEQFETNTDEQLNSTDKLRKQTGETNFTNPEPASPASPWSMRERGPHDKPRKSSRNLDLEERIREAKQRTCKALNLIKALKK